MTRSRTRPRRVFLSHAGELRDHPAGNSFVNAAEKAVSQAGDAVTDMSYFTARAKSPGEVCREMVRKADVLVVIAGFRYGSPVRDEEEVSYTELEHRTAVEEGIPVLVFLLDENTVGPAVMFLDIETGARQAAFRARLVDSGVTTATVDSPESLENKLLAALREPEEPDPEPETEPPPRSVWDVPAQRPGFVGRDGLLAEVDHGLRRRPDGRGATVALIGTVGVGKTATAIEYAHRHWNELDVAWWIPASDPAEVTDRLAHLARSLGLADESESAGVAVPRLRGELLRRDRWLLVFDRAGDPAELAELLPNGPGRVLVTTRDPGWTDHATGTVTMDGLSRTESIGLLIGRAPRLDERDANRLAEALGDLPLAIEQAGARLADSSLSVDALVDGLNVRATEVIEEETWAEVFDHLRDHEYAALELATLAAWLDPAPVPLTLFTENAEQLDGVAPPRWPGGPRNGLRSVAVTGELGPLCAVLHRLSMTAEVTEDTVRLHPIPAALLRARSRGNGNASASVARLLRAALPDEVADPVWQRLSPHVTALLDPDRTPDTDEARWLRDRAP